jgi:hypothetical protein
MRLQALNARGFGAAFEGELLPADARAAGASYEKKVTGGVVTNIEFRVIPPVTMAAPSCE